MTTLLIGLAAFGLLAVSLAFTSGSMGPVVENQPSRAWLSGSRSRKVYLLRNRWFFRGMLAAGGLFIGFCLLIGELRPEFHLYGVPMPLVGLCGVGLVCAAFAVGRILFHHHNRTGREAQEDQDAEFEARRRLP